MTTKKRSKLTTLNNEIETPAIVNSSGFLTTRRAILDQFDDLEDYAFSAPDPLSKELKAFEYHFNVLSNGILRVLRSHKLFIGASVITDLLFTAIKNPAVTSPTIEVLRILENNGIHRPGFVLYPLHSFSIAGVGILEALGAATFELVVPPAGMVVRAQTNDLRDTIRFLERTANHLGVRRRIPTSSLEHYARIPALRWLTHNPLLAVQVQTFSAEYYENQAFIIIKLKLATTLLFMLSALEAGLARKSDAWMGTGGFNNFETLDLKHYIVFEPTPSRNKQLDPRRVPMNVAAIELSELTAVPINITRGHWMRRKKFISKLCAALARIETGYLHAVLYPKIHSSQATLFRKLFLALSYFRRSFRLASDAGEAYVSLAVAFEVLLTDNYASGVDPRIRRRVRKSLGGIEGSRKLNGAVGGLYKARSEIVHTGQTEEVVDVHRVRQTFIHAFIYIVDRISGVPPLSKTPLEFIFGP
jgi:hypothetical protein